MAGFLVKIIAFLVIAVVVTSVLLGIIFIKKKNNKIIWEEEFDTLDTIRWKHHITGWRGGNNEFQYYSSSDNNSYVRNGILYIKPTLTADRFDDNFLFNGFLDLKEEGCNIDIDNGCLMLPGVDIINPIQSAQIVTAESYSFTFGSIEIRAKMPKGDWIRPSILLLPTDNDYGDSPRSGKMDVVESIGNQNLSCRGNQLGHKLSSPSLHWGIGNKRNDFRSYRLWESLPIQIDLSSDFHLYRFDWLERNGFRYYIDGERVAEFYPPVGGFYEFGRFGGNNIWANGSFMAPFDKPFHFVLNVAVGGNLFHDDCVNVPFNKPWTSRDADQMHKFWKKRGEWLPTWNISTEDNAMQVDYIRVSSLK